MNLLNQNKTMSNNGSICYESCEDSNYKLKCNHSFCNKCITHWLLLNSNCPCCRETIIDNTAKEDEAEDEEYEDDQENINIILNENMIVPINITESIVGRINDIINVIYYNSQPN